MLYFTFSMDTRDIVIPILMAVAVIGIGGFIALAILNDGFFDFGDGEEVEEDRDAEGI